MGKDTILTNECKSNWKQSLLVALIVAIITSGANYWIQSRLFESKTHVEYLARKLDLIHNTSELCERYRYLRSFKIRIYVLNLKECQKIAGSTDPNSLTGDQRIDVQMKLKEKYPFEYEKMLECDDLRPKIMSSLLMCQLYFGDKVKKEIDEMQIELSEDGFYNQIEDSIPKSVNIYKISDIDDLKVVQTFNQRSEQKLSNLLSALYSAVAEEDDRI